MQAERERSAAADSNPRIETKTVGIGIESCLQFVR